jgi:hypothetical protein
VHAKDKGSNSLASFSSHQALDQQAGRASIAWGPALLLAWPTARVRKSQGVQSGRGKRLATVLLPSSLGSATRSLSSSKKKHGCTRPGRGIILELRTASGKGLQE